MRFSALVLQADNAALEARPTKRVQQALARLVEVGLCLTFDHQGSQFLCDPTWQTFQKVEYPRNTILPKPVGEALAQCDAPTRRLFEKHPGGNRRSNPKNPDNAPEVSQSQRGEEPNPSQEHVEGAPTTRARPGARRLTADASGTRPTANASAPEAREEAQLTPQALGRDQDEAGQPKAPTRALLTLFDACHVERFGTKAAIDGGKDAAILAKLWRERAGDAVSIEALIRAFFDTDDPWVRSRGYTVGVFKSQIGKLLAGFAQTREASASAESPDAAATRDLLREVFDP